MKRNVLRASLIVTMSVSLGLAAGQALAQSGGKCPLTEDQSKKSVAAFAKIADFVTSEPRCVNCHGGVNPYIKGTGFDPEDPNAPFSLAEHGGKQKIFIRKKDDYGKSIDAECRDCHNNMARRTRDGSKSTWMTAAPFHSFPDKDAATLCRQFKRATETAEHFLRHVTDDNGDNNFAQTAFNGDRGLDPDQFLDKDNPSHYVAPQPPSMTHDAFIKLAQDWINAMGGKFQGDESCGCELTHDKWSGMIRYVLEEKGDEGHNGGPGFSSDWSSRSTTRIIVSLTDGVGTARYSVEGTQQVVNWHAGKPEWGIAEARQTATTTTSGQGTFPAMADVVLYQDAYQVFEQLLLQGQPNSAGNALIGKTHIELCDSQHGCSGSDTDLYAPMLPPLAPLNGKAPDQNHVFGTITLKRDGLGMSHQGVRIETMTVDLWRSPGVN